jgi:hypothetical protein
LYLAKSPDAAASATFWQSTESPPCLLAAIAGLLLIDCWHACLAAWAAVEFVLVPPEPELAVDVLLPLLLVLLLFLLLPQPVTVTLPTTTSASTTMTLTRTYNPLVSITEK